MKPDYLQRFIFDSLNIRGELVVLDETITEALDQHDYPPAVENLLAQSLCSALLLSSTLKFEGSVSIQAKGTGPIQLLVAEATHKRTVRGIAKWRNQLPNGIKLRDYLGEAQLAITITPDKGQRYQGIVPLERETLSDCLENYFLRSEQLSTRIWLFSHQSKIAGLMLQQLPEDRALENSGDDWQRLALLADTLTTDEIFGLESYDILHRLFNEDTIKVLTAEPTSFLCSCSEERTLEALKSIGKEEVQSILAEQGSVSMDCQFCNQHYEFSKEKLSTLFTPTLH